MATRREAGHRLGWGYWLSAFVLIPLMRLLTRRDWRGIEHIPPAGGCVVVATHATNLDPLTAGHFVYSSGRVLRYLAKSSLFRIPLAGAVLRSAQQIPVYRGTADAASALRDAVAAVRRGELVIMFPEGSLTRDPDLWPMRGKTGAARVALETGCPVVPVGQWGAHRILPRYSTLPRPFPRKRVHVWAGPPVDLAGLEDGPVDGPVLQEATSRIMRDLVAIVAEQRGETPPTTLFDPRASGLPETGKYSQ